MRGKRVLVTGATGGLGFHLVEAFLALDAQVIAVGRRRIALDDLRAALKHPERLELAECDVAHEQGTAALFESVERNASLDAVVHAVGAFRFGPFIDTSGSELMDLLKGNFESLTIVLRQAMRRMTARKAGSIVTIVAERATNPTRNTALYGATKAAALHLVKACAMEAASANVWINAISPGTMDTPANRQAMPRADWERWVKPQEVAQAAIWLASDDSNGVYGTNVHVPERPR